ncbi:PrsW family intramembrane metalloprotease [Candidatus Micrarchaeota archaeon]|nr:PrsW family intramembrane metalloprotease [Candidatus Micrarchaeota archaeon]
MLKEINAALPIFVALLVVSGILVSLAIIILPILLGEDLGLEELDAMGRAQEFRAEGLPAYASPDDSPYVAPLRVVTPPLTETDSLVLRIFGEGKELGEIDCLGEMESWEGITELECNATIPYNYQNSENYKLYAVLTREEGEYGYGPLEVRADWGAYENNFWSFAGNTLFCVGGAFLLLVVPLSLAAWWIVSRTKHEEAYEGEYSLPSLLSPFSIKRKMQEKVHAAMVSPYFWGVELLGILIVIFYMAVAGEVWKSWTAMAAFIMSGLIAFVVPFLWCFIWWYADYKEREPLRVLVTLFLWGMLAALMAIGINTVMGIIFGLVGLGFFTAFLVAPPVEEFFKGSGLLIFANHHEFNSIEDGIVFGFTIGMGFAFIENWIYLLGNPMGADVWSWLFLFLLRSIVFSANHGLYTAITGATIGYLIEKKFEFPALGLLIGVPIAALFHAMHNSGELMITLLGGAGVLLYCCVLIPFFDYGGLLLLIILFLRAVTRARQKNI